MTAAPDRQPASILIVGDDALAEAVCAELEASGNTRVRVVFPMSAEREAAFRGTGAAVTARDPDNDEVLLQAGVTSANAILTLSGNDERNLAVALRARMLNPHLRVVLRQFSTKIGRKIEQNLPDSTVLSLAAHSAATYAGAALDPGCFFALRFPGAHDGTFVGFTRATAADLDVGHLTVAEAEDRRNLRIVAVGDREEPPSGMLIDPAATIVAFGHMVERRTGEGAPSDPEARQAPQTVGAWLLREGLTMNPILRNTLLGAIAFYSLALSFFHWGSHSTWYSAAFDVAETMTNSGFGDASVAQRGFAITAGAIVFMIGGTVFTSIFIGYVSAAITRAQWTALQGLRRIRGRGHVVICGGGRIGGAAVQLLTAAGKRVVVIDSHPDPTLTRLARESRIDLLTGDATNEDVLELCDVPHAAAVIALTNSDAGNLEIALGARALRPNVPLVVRMESRTFAGATARLFGISTFSPAELSAPAFAGLARYPGTLGRIRFGLREHTIVRRFAGENRAGSAPGDVPLCVWRNEELAYVHCAADVRPGEPVLYAVPAADSPAAPDVDADETGIVAV